MTVRNYGLLALKDNRMDSYGTKSSEKRENPRSRDVMNQRLRRHLIQSEKRVTFVSVKFLPVLSTEDLSDALDQLLRFLFRANRDQSRIFPPDEINLGSCRFMTAFDFVER